MTINKYNHNIIDIKKIKKLDIQNRQRVILFKQKKKMILLQMMKNLIKLLSFLINKLKKLQIKH